MRLIFTSLFIIAICFRPSIVDAQTVQACLDDSGDGTGGTLTVRYIPSQSLSTGSFVLWASNLITLRYPSTSTVSFSNYSDLAGLAMIEDTGTPNQGVSGGDGFMYKKFSNGLGIFNVSMPDTTNIFSIDYTVIANGPVAFELIHTNSWTIANNGQAAIFNLGLGGNVFNGFVGDCDTSVVLPVSLMAFEGKKIGQAGVHLVWETAREVNNDFFVLEGGPDELSFEPIATFQGAGTYSGTSNYSYLDEPVYLPKKYYRLKQVDFDGNFLYSRTIEVDLQAEDLAFASLYPNPARDHIEIKIENSALFDNELIEVIIYDVTGRSVIVQEEELVSGRIRLEISQLSAGIYHLSLNNQSETISFDQKLIIR